MMTRARVSSICIIRDFPLCQNVSSGALCPQQSCSEFQTFYHVLKHANHFHPGILELQSDAGVRVTRALKMIGFPFI
jgi:hypothetical protein